MDIALLNKVKGDYPDLVFRHGGKFLFRPPKTIVIGPEEPGDALMLLHEVGHALSQHRFFDTGAKRLKMEREAWNKARGLAKKYGVAFDEDTVERELDTYRGWLDTKSRCPKCGLTRFQTPDGNFHCPRCENFTH